MGRDDAQTAVIGCLLLLLAAPLLALWRSFVLVKLWAWFVVPLGVPAVGMAHAYGLVVLVVAFSSWSRSSTDKERGALQSAGESIAIGVLAPLMGLLLGWVARCIMVG